MIIIYRLLQYNCTIVFNMHSITSMKILHLCISFAPGSNSLSYILQIRKQMLLLRIRLLTKYYIWALDICYIHNHPLLAGIFWHFTIVLYFENSWLQKFITVSKFSTWQNDTQNYQFEVAWKVNVVAFCR